MLHEQYKVLNANSILLSEQTYTPQLEYLEYIVFKINMLRQISKDTTNQQKYIVWLLVYEKKYNYL